MAIATRILGSFEGKPVEEAILEGTSGQSVHLMNWGVVVRDWKVPVDNALRSIVLGFEDFDPYPRHSPHFGGLAGRVANRVSGASFDLGGKTYKLPANEGQNQLHGGSGGLGRVVWQMHPDSAANAVRFTYLSLDGEMGYPGNVEFEVTYTLTEDRLRLELTAIPDRPTPISLVQHQYFNLGTTDTVLDHTVRLPSASRRTIVDNALLPTGEVAAVTGTDYDFSTARNLRDPEGNAIDYDLNFALDTDRDIADPIAEVTGPDNRLLLRLWSNRPGLQFYDSVMTNVSVPGLGGRKYGKYSGLCLEDQMWPGALHNPGFPSIVVSPDKPYAHWCEFAVTTA